MLTQYFICNTLIYIIELVVMKNSSKDLFNIFVDIVFPI